MDDDLTELVTDELQFVCMFEDGRELKASAEMLMDWCWDGHSWLSFMRGALHEDYAPEMTLLVPRHDPTLLKIVPLDGFVKGATFQDPFKGRAKPG